MKLTIFIVAPTGSTNLLIERGIRFFSSIQFNVTERLALLQKRTSIKKANNIWISINLTLMMSRMQQEELRTYF